ncbi:unnamed protein product [Chrysodeixis includens]|uniref:Mediator of RNA polymerase II transcription subunit 20 n=2 Tax=Noctuidae TaxID=7100 RepID=A0A9P0FY48_CHRIL|nr:unnamed protein product [Chrysodeixis includens]
MGVTVLQQYPVPENKTGTYVIELLTKRILALGATQQGQFLVDCESYLSHPQMGQYDIKVSTTKTVHIFHNSEQPASVFSILDTGAKNIHVIADGLFDLLMMKLSQHYTSKKQTKIESKGPRFELGDFCVKLGSVTMNQSFKGILIEVEYRPCVMANAVWGLLREFLQGLLGASVPVQPPQHLLTRMNEIYTPIDTIYQYLEHFSYHSFIRTVSFGVVSEGHITVILPPVCTITPVTLDVVDCGIDYALDVAEGDVELKQYPWLGILFYNFYSEGGADSRSVTTVVLIHKEFVVAPAADIGPMPKTNFRRNSRVLLGEGWDRPGRRVRNYVLHEEYEETYNTVALVQLRDPVRDPLIRPACPPPNVLRNPTFYVVRMKDDFDILQKEVINVMHIPGKMCKEFYVATNESPSTLRAGELAVFKMVGDCSRWTGLNPIAFCVKVNFTLNLEIAYMIVNHSAPRPLCCQMLKMPIAPTLYSKKMRPPHVACAVSVQAESVCVWGAGAALVARDVWGRWQLLGLGVRGPGCSAPSRYLDMMTYYPWIERSLAKFDRITISKLTNQKYVLRSSHAYQRFGACDEEEKKNLVFREVISLRTNNNEFQFLTYNLSIIQNIEYTCLTLELTNASAVSEMRIKHVCPRVTYGPACHRYQGSLLELSVYIMFSSTCLFEMYAWGFKKNMTLLDIQEWKWEEGTYYEDFSLTRVEYRGPTYMTEFGFEPLDTSMWIPEYDIFTTTDIDNSTTPTKPPVRVSRGRPTRPTPSTKKPKRTLKRRVTTTTTKTTTKTAPKKG